MTWRDLDLLLNKVFAVTYPGGSSLVHAKTDWQAMQFIRREKACPTGTVTALSAEGDFLTECRHYMEELHAD